MTRSISYILKDTDGTIQTILACIYEDQKTKTLFFELKKVLWSLIEKDYDFLIAVLANHFFCSFVGPHLPKKYYFDSYHSKNSFSRGIQFPIPITVDERRELFDAIRELFTKPGIKEQILHTRHIAFGQGLQVSLVKLVWHLQKDRQSMTVTIKEYVQPSNHGSLQLKK